MIEHNSNKLMWTVGAVIVAALLIVAFLGYSNKFINNVSFALEKEPLSSQPTGGPYSSISSDGDGTYLIKVASTSGRNTWANDVASVRWPSEIYNKPIPWGAKMTLTVQMKTDQPIVLKTDINNVPLNNDRSGYSTYTGNDNDLYSARQVAYGATSVQDSTAYTLQPSDDWTTITISYINESPVNTKHTPIVESGTRIPYSCTKIDFTNSSSSTANVKVRNFDYHLTMN